MFGEISALVSAILSAGSTVVSAKALKNVDPFRANLIRILFAGISVFPIALATGDLRSILTVNPYGIALVIISALVGFALADTILYKSMTQIGVSRSYTISYTYPFFTMALGVGLLSEPFLLKYVFGTIAIFLAVMGISSGIDHGVERAEVKGIIMAFATAILYAIGTIIVSIGLRYIGIILANTIRFPMIFLLMLFLSSLRKSEKRVARRDIFLLALSGIFGTTLSSLTFLYALQLIGAGRTTSLSASAPIWASLISVLFLKERVSWRTVASCFMVVVGIYLLS